MAFHLIQPASRQHLSPATEETGLVSGAQRAVDVLGPDYLRWSRLGLGSLAFLGVLVGASGPDLIIDTVSAGQSGVVLALAIVMGAVLTVILALSVWFLIRLARTGSALVRALSEWLGGPYRSGALAPSWSGWLRTRLLLFRPAVFMRVACGSCAGLFTVFAVFAFFSSLGGPSSVVSYACWAIVSAVTCICLFSGSIRLVNGRAQADRVWRTIRGS